MKQEDIDKLLNENFHECDTCSSEVGMPVLCSTCLHNRKLVTDLQNCIKMLLTEIGE